MRYLVILALLTCIGNSFAQQKPALKQTEAVTIVGATAHLGTGEIIKNSLIIFEEGKITQVMDAGATKMHYRGRIIEAQGKHVYPGFIAPNASLGLVEIDAVRTTEDENKIGSVLPHVRNLIAYNAQSKLVESIRSKGVLMGQIVPRGGRISGTSSIVQFDAWNGQDAVIKQDDGLHINWPSSFSKGRWWAGETPGLKVSEDYQEEILELKVFFNSSKAYLKGKRKKTNLAYEAMKAVFSGDKRVYIHVDGKKEILDVIDFKNDHELKHVVIVGGYEAHKTIEDLKDNNISVLVQRPHNTKNMEDDDYDFPYKLAGILQNKGIMVALESSGSMEGINIRNLPFYAGTAGAYGLGKEEALKLISSNTAKILGIDDKVGTLEKGKVATLFISQGDALDMRGNILTHAFIQGRELNLETHQSELYQGYMEKYDSASK